MKVALAVISLGLLAPTSVWGQAAPGLAEYQVAIERELGALAAGTVEVTLHPDGTATVTYHQPDGRLLGRTVALPPGRDDAVELVAMLAVNLVRDQSSGWDVSAAAGPTAPAPAPAPSPAPAPPPPAPAPGAAAATTTAAPAEVAVAPVSVSLLWPITTDSFYGAPIAARLGLHVIAGGGYGVHGVSLAGVADVQRGPVEGVQAAGVVAATSFQVRGVQLGGVVASVQRDVIGGQVAGVFALSRGLIDGIQAAGVLGAARQVHGVQVAGALAATEELRGLQLSVVNLAGHVRGVQLGVVNYARTSEGASIGLINIVRDGLTELDTTVDAAGTAGVVLRHGTPRFYSVYGAATTRERDLGLVGMGFGTRLSRTSRLSLDLDAMAFAVDGDVLATDLALLSRGRLLAALHLGRVAVLAGLELNVLVAGDGERGDALHPALDRSWRSDDVTTRMWPSASVGLRLQ